MKNPSFEPDKDKREIQRGASFDGLRTPLRPMQAGNPDVILQDLRLRIHRRLIDTLDLTKLSSLEMESVKVEIRRILEDMVMAEALPLSRTDRERLVTEVQHEAFGLGPLEFLMTDPTRRPHLIIGTGRAGHSCPRITLARSLELRGLAGR